MNQLTGGFEIKRKSPFDKMIEQQRIQMDELNSHIPEKPQENYIDESIVNSFQANINVVKNGQHVSKGGYYRDFETDKGRLYTNQIPIRPTNEPVEQVDPSSFFGSSLKGLI